ncbi:MAG: ABC transporter permease [Verrucomicrobiales bacterium]|nr:ABC transporter permease [Verrucomicrobiales bacterium]
MPVTGLAGGAVLAVFVLAALLAPVIAPYDPNESDTLERLLSPNASHWFGTDQLGRDIFSRILWGGRYTLGASLAVVALSATIATTVAVVSGYFGGKVDLVIQRFVDGWIAFPAFVLLIALISLLGPSLRNVIVVLSFTMAGGMSRILRSSVIVVKEASYIEMARVVGADPVRIMFRHILPQIVPLVLILASVQMGGVVLVLASLGFLGFGIPPPTPEWGSMLSGRARDFIYSAYWLALFPGLAITLTVLCLNLFFDSVRDIIDPRMRGTGRR